MEEKYGNILSFRATVDPGQWYDIRSEGLQHQTLYDAKIHEFCPNSNPTFDINLIDSINFGEGLCETLKISADSFVRNISDSKNITFMYFVLPPAPKYVLIKVEKIFKQKRAKFVNTVPDTTHFVKNVHYGNIVLVRIVPKCEDTNLNIITENFDEFLLNSKNFGNDFLVESLTNFDEWKHHESINAAMEYANQRIEWREEKRVVRFDLQKIDSKKVLWQEEEDFEGILERILRINFLCHLMEIFLRRAGNDKIDPTKLPTRKYFANLLELGKIIDEKGKTLLENDLINPTANFSVNEAHEYAKGFFQDMLILKADCQRFLKKRAQLIHKPKFENEVMDRNIIIFNLFHSIYGFLSRNNFELHFGKLFHVIRAPKHQTIINLKQQRNQKILIINGEKSVQEIQYYYETFEAQKIFLICLSSDHITLESNIILNDKSEKALYFQGCQESYNLGHFEPTNVSHHEEINSKSLLPWTTLPCPCKKSAKDRIWICTKCKEIVQNYDETSLICNCGISSLVEDHFKCINENHSTNFLNFDQNSNTKLSHNQFKADENANDEIIENIFYNPETALTYQKHPKIKKLNGAARKKFENATKAKSVRSKTINIVVIGESGVGKSTLLNAIANYLKFETAEMALKNDLEYIIPCQFKVFYDDFSERLVSIGNSDKNEQYQFETSESTALSTTQECKEHSFEFKGYKINFIDTPGLSDTLGIEKDERNLEKIRSFICAMDSLHAICFVVKANEARMDIAFSKAMNDLLSIFPKSALSKIIFFMTHSRGTLYGPGDTMTPLTAVSLSLAAAKGVTFPLSSANIFCVDNEAFLYLCAKHCGIEYSEASLADFENSWKKTKQATLKFFNKVTTSKPLATVEIQIIKDLENVLQEQKEILYHKHSGCLLIFHYLTAKALELLELGNSANAYLKDINLEMIKDEAEHCNVKIDHITPSTLLSFINFCLECESGETPVADSFIDKYFSE
uniref:AAA+ ATPase domain-containing protein n=1 Tax=Panagrolaimus superbus TaxID=310955 RepID=A0A914YWL8_9BILA